VSDDEPTQVEGAAGRFTSVRPRAGEIHDTVRPPAERRDTLRAPGPPSAEGTLAERRREDSAEPWQSAQLPAGGSTLTATLAVREEQDAQGRAMVRLILFVAGLSAIAIQTPQRVSPGKLPATIALFALAGTASAFLLGVLATLASLVTVVHVGVFSPVVMALFVLVYFYGLGDQPLHGWVVYVLGSGGYVVLCVLAMLGIIPIGEAIFALHRIELVSMIAVTVVIGVFLSMTFWLARQSRAATLRAMGQLERARRQIRQREALLHEARAELDNALDAGRLGRFTGQDIGQFLVEEVIGRGAMGEVYAARHTETGEAAALKVLHRHAIDDPAQVERFFREAEISGALDSPHVVRVFGTGFAADGSPYLAMERLGGHDLAWHLRESRRFGLRKTVELIGQVAQALSAAQDAGIVHRDLKPQNLFACEGPYKGNLWKVLDFGVSKIASGASTLTQDAAVGTPSYMAPEQARGDDVDHRADVFALGVIAYRALTGRPAFTGADVLVTMYNVVHVQPARPSDLAELDEDIDLVLALALAKDRARRLPSASSLAAAFRDAARGELDARLRRDARDLLESHGWGQDETASPRRAES
jgi:serine/threonine-protein kinase